MEKSRFIKKSPEIKSYQFETLFSRTFFLAPVWFYTKSPRKKSPLTSENAWFTMEKEVLVVNIPSIIVISGAWYVNTPGYIYIFNMEKVRFYENFSDLTSFSKIYFGKGKKFSKKKYKIYLLHMYIFITSLVSIFFFILLKNIELALYMMYTCTGDFIQKVLGKKVL